jgi:fumarylacetoacetase
LTIAFGTAAPGRCVARIGDDVVEVPGYGSLDKLLAAPRSVWTEVSEELRTLHAAGELEPLGECEPVMPFTVGDYVDFFSSIEHATNLGRLFRPGSEPLLPNWRHMPVGYHGRAATIVASGAPIRRPQGQLGLGEFGPTQALDIELELGFVIGGRPNAMGEPIPIETAAERIFGVVLVNDWSARDIQRFEYQPLGPFLGKSFATSISPWVVPIDSLADQRVPGPAQDPPPLPYLSADEPWNFDIELAIELNGEVISSTNSRGLYWNAAQQLAHASVNGAVIRPGDLLATGTISGATPDQCGSLIEIGRPFLEDGDEVVLRGRAGEVALGAVAGRIDPA